MDFLEVIRAAEKAKSEKDECIVLQSVLSGITAADERKADRHNPKIKQGIVVQGQHIRCIGG